MKNYTVKVSEYDTDGKVEDLPLTLSILVPDEIEDTEEYLSNEISNLTGYCHKGFTYEEQKP